MKIIFFAKTHCEIQVHTILVCALNSIKYGDFYIVIFKMGVGWDFDLNRTFMRPKCLLASFCLLTFMQNDQNLCQSLLKL
jgi:hypothetical protein